MVISVFKSLSPSDLSSVELVYKPRLYWIRKGGSSKHEIPNYFSLCVHNCFWVRFLSSISILIWLKIQEHKLTRNWIAIPIQNAKIYEKFEFYLKLTIVFDFRIGVLTLDFCSLKATLDAKTTAIIYIVCESFVVVILNEIYFRHKLEFNDFLYDPERADGLAPSDDQIWYKKRSFGSSWVP